MTNLYTNFIYDTFKVLKNKFIFNAIPKQILHGMNRKEKYLLSIVTH